MNEKTERPLRKGVKINTLKLFKNRQIKRKESQKIFIIPYSFPSYEMNPCLHNIQIEYRQTAKIGMDKRENEKTQANDEKRTDV